jgi:hypothetical protein
MHERPLLRAAAGAMLCSATSATAQHVKINIGLGASSVRPVVLTTLPILGWCLAHRPITPQMSLRWADLASSTVRSHPWERKEGL